jgi:hypothetical protein
MSHLLCWCIIQPNPWCSVLHSLRKSLRNTRCHSSYSRFDTFWMPLGMTPMKMTDQRMSSKSKQVLGKDGGHLSQEGGIWGLDLGSCVTPCIPKLLWLKLEDWGLGIHLNYKESKRTECDPICLRVRWAPRPSDQDLLIIIKNTSSSLPGLPTLLPIKNTEKF